MCSSDLRWARENDPIDRYVKRLVDSGWADEADLKDIDERVAVEIDEATDACEGEPLPAPDSSLTAVYARPGAAPRLWFRDL